MPQYPKPLIDPQELARRNNENAAAHRLYRARRRLRRKLPRRPGPCGLEVPDKLLDAADRQEAVREARPVRAVGFFLTEKT